MAIQAASYWLSALARHTLMPRADTLRHAVERLIRCHTPAMALRYVLLPSLSVTYRLPLATLLWVGLLLRYDTLMLAVRDITLRQARGYEMLLRRWLRC